MKLDQHIKAAEKASENLDIFAVVDPAATAMSGVLHALLAIARIERLRLRRELTIHPVFNPSNPCGNTVCTICYPAGAQARD